MTRAQRWIGVVVAALVIVSVVPAVAQSEDAAPKATEIGVTPTEVRIAIVADVDNPFAPGLFQGVVDGLRGATRYLNSKAGGGGVAGRKLVVDFIDSKLSPNEARNGVITACQQDLAMVGSAALFLANMDDAVNCKDSAGAVSGLPDIAAIATGVAETCAPVTYPIGGTQLICSTKDQHPQTYNVNQGDFKYFQRQHRDLHGALIASNDTKDATRGGAVLIGGAIQAGIKADQNVTRSGRDQQSAFTGIVNQMKQDGSNYSLIVMTANSASQLRSEAQLQGLTDPNVVWECVISCYDKALKANAAVMDGEYIPLSFLPFEEEGSNATLDNFLHYVGKDKANGFAVYGWVAGLAFGQAVKAVVAKNGVNGLTRRSLVSDGISTLTKFNAGGMVSTVDIAHRTPGSCFMLVQFRDGKFQRVYPKKKGTFDCKSSNSTTVKADLVGG